MKFYFSLIIKLTEGWGLWLLRRAEWNEGWRTRCKCTLSKVIFGTLTFASSDMKILTLRTKKGSDVQQTIHSHFVYHLHVSTVFCGQWLISIPSPSIRDTQQSTIVNLGAQELRSRQVWAHVLAKQCSSAGIRLVKRSGCPAMTSAFKHECSAWAGVLKAQPSRGTETNYH